MQVIATVVSLDPEIQADVVSMIGASAALACSGMPFQGPIGAARVGYVDGNYVLNPGISKLEESDLDLVVAGTDNAVLMVESEAAVLPEEVMLGAVIFGHEQMQVVINAIREMAAEVGTEAWQIEEVPTNDALAAQVAAAAEAGLTEAYMTADKMERQQKVGEVRDALVEQLVTDAEDSPSKDDVKAAFSTLEKSLVRGRILSGERRIDGRDTRSVRPIAVKTGLLPRVHGSSLFTRGETQAIVAATLGTTRDAQIIDALEGERRDAFMLHYNFPPYCVGETGFVGSPKRREIGHGRLAKRGVAAVMPDSEVFPYTVRVVSEITESNGSSSMASVLSLIHI